MLLSAEQKNNEEIKNQLVNLWCEVFSDSEEYVRLILPFLPFFDCYAVFEKEEIVSAMYLLPSEIKIGEKLYKGRYLYAAATKEKSRKNGYMSLLINEAIDTLKDKADFISLVPANDGLYFYYARFGFESAMYNYVTKLTCDGVCNLSDGEALKAEKVNALRKEYFSCAHHFSDKTMEYALDCYRFFGSEFLERRGKAFLYADDENTVYEGLFESSEREEYVAFLKETFKGETEVISAFRLNEASEKTRCGMVKAFNSALQNEKEIYMNHTLM